MVPIVSAVLLAIFLLATAVLFFVRYLRRQQVNKLQVLNSNNVV